MLLRCNTGNDFYQEFEVGDNTNEDEGLRMRSKIKREGLSEDDDGDWEEGQVSVCLEAEGKHVQFSYYT